MNHTYCVIMAGGKGERFWPLSREGLSKPFIKLIGDKTLLQMTVDRVLSLIARERIYVVLGKEHLEVAMAQLSDFSADQFIVEPTGRDTAPCIGLAASILARKDPQALMVVLPADHFVPDVDRFARTLSFEVECAKEGDYLITTGILPTRPETGYGYIHASEAVRSFGSESCLKVNRFVEKPNEAKALEYIAEGNYFWNSGMFVWRASTVLDGMARHMPGLHAGLLVVSQAYAAADTAKIEAAFVCLPKISIDYGLMEKADNVLMVKADFRWDDVGAWSSLRRVKTLDENGNYLQGDPVCIDTKDCVIYGDNIRVGTVGVSNLIVVASEEGVLVCAAGRDQETRQIARMMENDKEQ